MKLWKQTICKMLIISVAVDKVTTKYETLSMEHFMQNKIIEIKT